MKRDLDSSPDSADTLRAWLIVGLGFAVTVAFGIWSDGYYHADDLTHFLMARWSWSDPRYLLHLWGRPGFTVPYALVAPLGWWAGRLLSAVLSAVTALIAYRIATLAGVRRAWLVPLFLYLQPRYFTLALTTLTETALAFYLTAGVLLAMRRRWIAAGAILSVAFLTRYEVVILAPAFLWFALNDRRFWGAALAMSWAPLLHAMIGWFCGMPSALELAAGASGSGVYGSGGWFSMPARSVEAMGMAVLSLGVIGSAAALRLRGGPLIVAAAMGYVAVHTVLRWFGLFNTGGYARFMVAASPLMAILAVVGWNRITSRNPQHRAQWHLALLPVTAILLYAVELETKLFGMDVVYPELYIARWTLRGYLALLTLAVLVEFARQSRGRTSRSAVGPATWAALMLVAAPIALCRPLDIGTSEQQIDRDIAWMRQHKINTDDVLTTHVWAVYRLDQSPDPKQRVFAELVSQARPGTIILWDRNFAAITEVPPVTLDDMAPPKFERLPSPSATDCPDRLGIFRKIAP